MDEISCLVKLGERIKKQRLNCNFTQEELALKCGFEKGRMSRIESGQANPTIRTLIRICDALEIQLVDLFC